MSPDKNPNKHFDLTEEASKRKSEAATNVAGEENDDLSNTNNTGAVNSEDEGVAENKVSTSLDEE
jgi:hypothetical protein